MGTSIQLRTNIVGEEDLRSVSGYVLETLNDSLSKSAGPFGRYTIIQEASEGHRITKDGFSILSEIRFDEAVCCTIYQIIKDVSARLVETVGDGSTASILSSYHFYKILDGVLSSINMLRIRPQMIIDMLDHIIAKTIEELKKMARPISEDLHEIRELASVSLNNNRILGDVVAEIYEKYGLDSFITIKFGNELVTRYEVTKGFQLLAGLEDVCLCNTLNKDNKVVELENTAILVFAEACNNATSKEVIDRAVLRILQQEADDKSKGIESKFNSILILAPGYSDEIWQYFTDLASRSAIMGRFNFIRMNYSTEIARNAVEDLCTVSGARKIFAENYDDVRISKGEIDVMEYFGFSESVVTGEKFTTISGNGDDASNTKLQNAIETTEMKLKVLKEDPNYDQNQEYILSKRLAVLKQTLITILVGGNSEQQRKTNNDLIVDAVAACRSALEHGYVIGGNMSIPICIEQILENSPDSFDETEKVIAKAVAESFENVFKEVLKNACVTEENEVASIINKCKADGVMYDLITQSYSSEKIINSVETEIEILRTMVSIIGLLLTSNQFIQNNKNPRMVHYHVGNIEIK